MTSNTASLSGASAVSLLIVGLKCLKFAGKVIKLAKTSKGFLGVASAGAYSALLGWQLGLLLIVALLIHEYGHVWMMKRCGMRVRGLYLIPLVGAAIVPEDGFPNRWIEFKVAIAGPCAGLAFSVVLLLLWWIVSAQAFAMMAGINIFINLLNLLPLYPLDGGKIVHAIGFSVNRGVGLGVFVIGGMASAYVLFSDVMWPFTSLMMLLFVWSAVSEYRGPSEEEIEETRCNLKFELRLFQAMLHKDHATATAAFQGKWLELPEVKKAFTAWRNVQREILLRNGHGKMRGVQGVCSFLLYVGLTASGTGLGWLIALWTQMPRFGPW